MQCLQVPAGLYHVLTVLAASFHTAFTASYQPCVQAEKADQLAPEATTCLITCAYCII